MKVAVITDDGRTISQHFGRAAHYLVFTVEDGKITGSELRDKLGHQHFANEPHTHEHHEHGAHGHGFDPQSEAKHGQMIDAIRDCDALIVRGMGRGAYESVARANIKPYVTTIASPTEAVQALIDGRLVDQTDRLH